MKWPRASLPFKSPGGANLSSAFQVNPALSQHISDHNNIVTTITAICSHSHCIKLWLVAFFKCLSFLLVGSPRHDNAGQVPGVKHFSRLPHQQY